MIKIFYSFLLIVLFFLSTVAFTIFQVQKPGFLAHQAQEVNLYGRIAGNAEHLISDDLSKQTSLSKKDLAQILTTAITAERFYGFLDRFLSAYLGWLTGRADQLVFHYDLTSVEQSAKDKAVERSLANYNNLPICKADQLKNWGFETGLPVCQLTSGKIQSNEIQRLIQTQVDKSASAFPTTINSPGPSSGLLVARRTTIRVLTVVRIIWLISLLATGIYLAIWRRKAMVSLAIIFLIVGLMQVGFSLIAWDWIGRNIADLVTTNQTTLAPVLIDLTTAVLEVLKTMMGNLSIFSLSLGGLLLILGFFWRPAKQVI